MTLGCSPGGAFWEVRNRCRSVEQLKHFGLDRSQFDSRLLKESMTMMRETLSKQTRGMRLTLRFFSSTLTEFPSFKSAAIFMFSITVSSSWSLSSCVMYEVDFLNSSEIVLLFHRTFARNFPGPTHLNPESCRWRKPLRWRLSACSPRERSAGLTFRHLSTIRQLTIFTQIADRTYRLAP